MGFLLRFCLTGSSCCLFLALPPDVSSWRAVNGLVERLRARDEVPPTRSEVECCLRVDETLRSINWEVVVVGGEGGGQAPVPAATP